MQSLSAVRLLGANVVLWCYVGVWCMIAGRGDEHLLTNRIGG